MNKEYKIKLDLNKKLYNKKMMFNQFDENVNDFYIEITKNNEVVKDLDKSIITLVAIKPNNAVDAQFIEVKEGQIYADLKPSMCDLVGNYQAKAMIVLEGEIVTTDTINYSVNEDKIISKLNEDVASDERFTLFTDALARLSDIEASEEQRIVNEAERILSEENRKIEEAKRVEAELIRQHEEADRAKYDATRESNENIRKQNESIRLANETNRIDEEAKRVEEETKRVEAEQLRKDNYNFMTEDEERRRSEANAHKEAENLRVQAETIRVNEEAKRRTTEQARVSAENTRVSNESTRKANEETRQTNETQRVEAETQRQNRYNSFIADAEANANNFENYTNTAKAKEEERKSNELDRKSQENKRVSNEVERISNENTRKANEVAREKNEASRQDIFENKVNEVDKKIVELNTTKDNFVSSVNTKVDNKISELDKSKSDMTNTVTNKIDEVETRFNALTSSQQQDAEVIDARDGETSLKARLDRDIEKAKQVYVNVEGSHISTDSSVGYAKNIEILGNTIQSASNLADIRSVGDKVEGQELYEIPVLSCGKNIFNSEVERGCITDSGELVNWGNYVRSKLFMRVSPNTNYIGHMKYNGQIKERGYYVEYDKNFNFIKTSFSNNGITTSDSSCYIKLILDSNSDPCDLTLVSDIQLEEGTQATPYEPYIEDKLTILSPVQLEKVGDVADRLIEKDGVWGVEKNVVESVLDSNTTWSELLTVDGYTSGWRINNYSNVICDKLKQLTIDEWRSNTVKGLYSSSTNMGIIIPSSELNSESSNGLNEWIRSNQPSVKYPTTQPQFIPLPHDQQVKLRTFANKTNISFLTEIEGTIKAQVPKSLGATVNTHTEQIRSLNNELNRVKKLEESTVSTVTTESDFTTVEQTTSGYFEDVKLEGKTLVNLADKTRYTETIEGWKTTLGNMGLYKTNTTYTFIGDVITLADGVSLYIDGKTLRKGHNMVTFTTGDTVGYITLYSVGTPGSFVVDNVLVLEGDHTQNPPSYFEGLKSVGQSATTSETDEIVVSSVNENLFDVESFINFGLKQSGKFKFPISLEKNTTYTFSDDVGLWNASDVYIDLKNKNDMLVCDLINPNLANRKQITFTTDSVGGYCLETYANNIPRMLNITTNFMLNEGTTPKPYTPHQSDKKRLLYYNTETQTWEKPILREWDSIEKHANGKYYYHQRSGEVVLNGSEDWKISTNGLENRPLTSCFNLLNLTIGDNVLNDKFKVVNNLELSNIDYEVFDNFRGSIWINIYKSKLTTDDAAGFKQWLQANNVTVVYQLAQEKVYECTNIDLITYANETNYIVESGAIAPKTTLKVHSNISNVVSLLQKKVSLLESNITSYMITQNRLMLASRYNADTVSFKVDVASFSDTFEYDNDLYELILNNILVGKDNYNREYIENLIIFYWMDFIISDEMYSTLFEIIEEQHNPKVIEDQEETPLI